MTGVVLLLKVLKLQLKTGFTGIFTGMAQSIQNGQLLETGVRMLLLMQQVHFFRRIYGVAVKLLLQKMTLMSLPLKILNIL